MKHFIVHFNDGGEACFSEPVRALNMVAALVIAIERNYQEYADWTATSTDHSIAIFEQ